jgi:hypothetical protein
LLDTYDELLDAYPYEILGGNGIKYPARTGTSEKNATLYAKHILKYPEQHKIIIAAVKFGKENSLIKWGIEKFIENKYWGLLIEAMEGNSRQTERGRNSIWQQRILSRSYLPIISSRQAAANALKDIEEGMSEEQVVLLCRWEKVNRGLLGGWRFCFTYIIAGLSGSGKSYFLNMIRKDFTNRFLNGRYKRKFRQLHIAFEMTAADEVLRDVSGQVKTSYGDIISAYKSVDGSRLSLEKYEEIKDYLKTIADLEIDYIEVTGTVQQVYATILDWDQRYPDEQKIISLDHTLLTDFDKEADEIALVANLSKMFLKS